MAQQIPCSKAPRKKRDDGIGELRINDRVYLVRIATPQRADGLSEDADLTIRRQLDPDEHPAVAVGRCIADAVQSIEFASPMTALAEAILNVPVFRSDADEELIAAAARYMDHWWETRPCDPFGDET